MNGVSMSESRRSFFRNATVLGAGLMSWAGSVRAQKLPSTAPSPGAQQKNLPHPHSKAARMKSPAPEPMQSPDISDLPFTLDGGTKVFRLVAEPLKRRIVPWKTLDVWGYNGSCPGPTIQITQGDRVRILVENRLPESTSMHWHGIEVPIEQDGVPFVSQRPIAPGETYTYEFTVHQEGTFFYHAHSAMQEMIGLIGMFVAHPRDGHSPRVDHDYGIVLQEWAVLPNNSVPNTANMEFNWLTFNGVAAPLTTPLLARLGSRVRLRFVNLGMDHHPIHLHGNQFVVTGTEGGRAPESTWFPSNTVLVGVAQARVVEFDAKYPGAWMIHCHLPHHMMNSMMDLLRDRQIMTSDQTESAAMQQMRTLAARAQFQHQHPSPVAPDAEKVPGFPQDAFMEMGMDELVQKPETHGLPKNWSAGMMGMMTMVRVLPDKEFEEIAALKKSGTTPASAEEHHHGS
jgi:manganese oxidase